MIPQVVSVATASWPFVVRVAPWLLAAATAFFSRKSPTVGIGSVESNTEIEASTAELLVRTLFNEGTKEEFRKYLSSMGVNLPQAAYDRLADDLLRFASRKLGDSQGLASLRTRPEYVVNYKPIHEFGARTAMLAANALVNKHGMARASTNTSPLVVAEASSCHHDAFDKVNLWRKYDGRLPSMRLLENGVLSIDLVNSLSPGVYGEVDVGETPFRIKINASQVNGRVPITMMHELLHVGDELLKLRLPHQDLHQLAVFLTSNFIPALESFSKVRR